MGADTADKNFSPVSIIIPNMNSIHIHIKSNELLKNFNTKTLTFVDANADARGSRIAYRNFLFRKLKRDGLGRRRKINESEETEEVKTFPLYLHLLQW